MKNPFEALISHPVVPRWRGPSKIIQVDKGPTIEGKVSAPKRKGHVKADLIKIEDMPSGTEFERVALTMSRHAIVVALKRKWIESLGGSGTGRSLRYRKL